MKSNVKRIIGVIAIVLVLAACENPDSKVNQVIQNQMQEAIGNAPLVDKNEPPKQESNSKNDEIKEDKNPVSGTETKVDVDLTKLSSTMVYSEVYNMMYVPEQFVGKVVRMRGAFAVYTDMFETVFYPAVIVADATACCAQGLEFLLEGNPPYPQGYPEVDDIVTVVGTFELYEEDGEYYCRLQNAWIE